ncbi:MAG: mannose-1-phosphate guanylyltransferase [Bacteroidota bacterium]
MAGGIGSRFWPMSRNYYPKQFHDVLGMGKTMLQQTAERYATICPDENIYVVTNRDYYALVKKQLPMLSDEQILLEPVGRNTAPCVAYAAAKIYSRNPNANLIVAPSDHVILKEEEFRNVIRRGLEATAAKDILMTLGIRPSRPDTGYGYIQFNDGVGDLRKVKTFTEKPHLELAKKFIESGEFVWNSGIFLWSAKSVLAAIEKLLPELHEIFEEGKDKWYTEDEKAFINSAYAQCKNISIDYGIMEKSENVYVMLSEFGWSDLGTWKSLYDISDKDSKGNVLDGNIMIYDTTNSIVKTTSKDKLIVVHGLDNFIIAESDDVIMICPKDEEQRVKDFVADAKAAKDKRFM